jgi:hypothetical protein
MGIVRFCKFIVYFALARLKAEEPVRIALFAPILNFRSLSLVFETL